MAFDRAASAIYTVGAAESAVARAWSVSRFDRGDMTLSSEFLPALEARPGLALGAGRTIDELYSTAATFHGGRLWALSAAYSTLVAIDVDHGRIVEAYGVPGVARPAGLAVRDGRFVVAAEDGTLTTVPIPGPVPVR